MLRNNKGLESKNKVWGQRLSLTLPCRLALLQGRTGLMRPAPPLRRDLILAPSNHSAKSQRENHQSRAWRPADPAHGYCYFRCFLRPQEMGKRREPERMQFPRCTMYLITNHSVQAMPAGFTVLLQMNPFFKPVFLILDAFLYSLRAC